MEESSSKEGKGRKYIYFVDKEKYEVDTATVLGALIKAKLPEAKREYSLFLEGHGNDPDILMADEASVPLEQGAKHFYTSPPASFGL